MLLRLLKSKRETLFSKRGPKTRKQITITTITTILVAQGGRESSNPATRTTHSGMGWMDGWSAEESTSLGLKLLGKKRLNLLKLHPKVAAAGLSGCYRE